MEESQGPSARERSLGSYLAVWVGTIVGAALLWFITQRYLQWSREDLFPPFEPDPLGLGSIFVMLFIVAYELGVTFVGTWIGACLGCWLGLRLLGYAYAARTAFFLLFLAPFAVSDHLDPPLLRLAAQVATLAVSATAARMITLSAVGSSRRTLR